MRKLANNAILGEKAINQIQVLLKQQKKSNK